MILLTALLRHLAANRLPRRMYIALWDVALLASLIPFRVPWEALASLFQRTKETVAGADGAVFSVPSQAQGLVQGAGLAVSPGTAAPVSELPRLSLSGIQDRLTQAVEPLRETARTAPEWLWHALGVAWLVGAAVLAIVLLVRWASCLRVFSEALPCEDRRAEAFLREHRLLRLIRVRTSGRVSSPLSYGLLRPVILLPAAMAGTDDRTLGYVLTHEFMHIRAWDMLRKELLLLALCLHWFNPLAWVMLRLYSRDMELMCDERVVRSLGGRKAYCLTLLDMEARRSNLTMGTCFSVTGIEERIKVMKNRKHQGILSIALALAIFFGAAAGAVTGIPLADAEGGSPKMFFSRETWENTYAKYEPFGLGYDAENGTITYNGQVVRYFEDMWPVGEQGKAGTCFMVEGGTVDVYGVREFSEVIQRNPDGSFDPSGTLIGLREATQEEYVERAARMKVEYLTLGMATEYVGDYQVVDTVRLISDKMAATVEPSDVVWWTAEEFREWMEQERVALQQLVEEEARAWTPSTGWFTWTQERVDAAMARYEDVLAEIEQGVLVSRTINGEDANMVLVQELGNRDDSSDAPEFSWGFASGIPQVAALPDDSTLAEEATAIVFTTLASDTIRYGQEEDLGSESEGKVVLVAVGPGDEWRYTPAEWAHIQGLIEQGIVQWNAPEHDQEHLEDVFNNYSALRLEEWRSTLAPYAPFGVSYVMDAGTDLVRLYWMGKEIRGIFDPERGMWITEHAGNGYYPDGARELIAVYQDGVLTGLREADEQESLVWDKLRTENVAE